MIEGVCARRCDVTVDAEDCVDMHISAAMGFASVHLSYLSHLNQRRITMYFPDRTIVADLISNTVSVYRENVLSQQISLPIERDELFGRQIDYFMNNSNNPNMMNNIMLSVDLFKKICSFKERCHVA